MIHKMLREFVLCLIHLSVPILCKDVDGRGEINYC